MGDNVQTMGNNGKSGLVHLYGYQGVVSLDSRGRFRLPDDLAAALHRALGAVRQSPASETPPAMFERLSFYFVPGPLKRIFLYPTCNIRLAVQSFESPPPGLKPDVVRRARDYFYLRMRFVEADRQNRLVVPDGLRLHAGIDERVEQIALVAQNYWLALSRTELVEERTTEDWKAFEEASPDLLDPVCRAPDGTSQPDQHP
jgi:DNA-binding transcriptional regulator/RsmH inhibitor MraZ